MMLTEPRESERPSQGPGAALARLGGPILGLLAIQFLLGMALNLFAPPSGATPLSILASNPVLIGHVILGVLLVGITIRAVVLAVRLRRNYVIGVALLGFVSTASAFLAGLMFTFGAATGVASFVMSAGFAGILVSGGALLGFRPILLGSLGAENGQALSVPTTRGEP